MSLRHVALLAIASVLLMGCPNDNDDEEVEPTVEPQASLGESVTYRGAEGTDAEWEMEVVVEEVDCDIEIDEVEVDPVDGRLCAVRLQLENTGQEPNIDPFFQSSSLLADDGEIYLALDVASTQYMEEQGLEPILAVEPGGSAEEYMVFSVSDDAEPEYLYLKAGPDDEFFIIDLGS